MGFSFINLGCVALFVYDSLEGHSPVTHDAVVQDACRFFAQLWGVDVTPHSHKVSQQRAGSSDCGVHAVNNIVRSPADFPTCRTQGKSWRHFCSDYFIVPTCWIDLSDPRKFLPKKAPTIETLVYGICFQCEARPERKKERKGKRLNRKQLQTAEKVQSEKTTTKHQAKYQHNQSGVSDRSERN